MADFTLVSRRNLDEVEYKIFKFHYLLGADWSLCCRRLEIDRGDFFHHVYRIQQKLGRTFRELEPYALFPLDEYFHGARRSVDEISALFPVVTEDEPRNSPPIRFPIKRAA